MARRPELDSLLVHRAATRGPPEVSRASSGRSSSSLRISALCSPRSGERVISTGESDRVNGHSTAPLGMLYIDDHPRGLQVFIFEKLLDVYDGARALSDLQITPTGFAGF